MTPEELGRNRFQRYLSTAPRTMVVGTAIGGAIALLALLVGATRIVFALLAGTPIRFEEFGMLVYYVGGFIVGGMFAGLLWPLRRWIGKSYGLGIVVMSFVMAAIIRAEEGPVSGWDTATWIMLVALSLLFGIALGHGARSAED